MRWGPGCRPESTSCTPGPAPSRVARRSCCWTDVAGVDESSDALEKPQRPLPEQPGCLLVVVAIARVGEVVAGARIEEQLGVADIPGQRACRDEVLGGPVV